MSETSEALERAADPTQIDRYIVECRIGGGSFGDVYRSFDPELDRMVAIKLYRREAIEQLGGAESLLSEARILANLVHPGIVGIDSVGNDTALGPFVDFGSWRRDCVLA